MTATQRPIVTIWGHVDCAPPSEPGVILWARFADNSDPLTPTSLPAAIHADRSFWKVQYSTWLRTVGDSYERTSQAQDFQNQHEGLSYWWMTVPTQFTFSRDGTAYAVLRLMALVDALVQARPHTVRLNGLPPTVVACVEPWCRERGMEIEVSSKSSCSCPQHGVSLSGGRADALRHMLSAFARYGRTRAPVSTVGPVVVDYLDNVRPGSGVYDSQYWGPLVSLIDETGPGQWQHIDVRSRALPTSMSARRYAQGLSPGRHTLVQDAMSLSMLRRSLSTFRRIEAIGREAWQSVSFVDVGRGIDTRALVAQAWHESHTGTTAAVNALDIHFMDALAASAAGPGLYLMENQPWEMALLHAWRRHNAAPIAGFVHSLARDWDLRYALPSCGPVKGCMPPTPDQCLVGSAHEAAVLVENGYVASSIIEVEAVRFLGGDPADPRPAKAAARRRLLVLGEYDEHSNDLLLQSLLRADLKGLEVAYRPHPSRQDAATDLPASVTLSAQPGLAEALAQSDVVVGMGTSTAVLTAVQSGVPVITLQDAMVLDGSVVDPSSVLQVPSSVRIDLGLIERAGDPAGRSTARREQHRDPALPRWRAWLASRS